VYARARYFVPGAGIWGREDPVNAREVMLMAQSPGSPRIDADEWFEDPLPQNRYTWPYGNPVMFRDPTGAQADVAALGIGALSGLLALRITQRFDSVAVSIVNALLQIARFLVVGATSQAALYVEFVALLGWASVIYATSGLHPWEVPPPPTKSYQTQPGRPEPKYPKPPGTGCKGTFDVLMARCLMKGNYCGRIFCAIGASLFYVGCVLAKGGG
jgi:hypothetical protein